MENIARLIDSTILKPDAQEKDIVALCQEAREEGFKTVCVNPSWVSRAHELLQGSQTGVTTVIGFPLGATTTATKVFETENAIANGADEIDMVINIGRLKDGDLAFVTDEISQVKMACHGHTLKVIIECCLLTDEEKRRACECIVKGGADFAKTSTGFSKSGATAADVALMRSVVGPHLGVKAAGGVRNYDELVQMVKAGANRIGTSHGKAILDSQR